MRRLVPLVLCAAVMTGCPPPANKTAAKTDAKTAQTDGEGQKTGDAPADTRKLEDWKAKLQPKGEAWRSVQQVFTFNNGAEPETLDLHLMTGVPENRLATALFEGLVAERPDTLEPIPGVAESWTVSGDGLVYTFKLRADAKWTDGQPVTAKDFRDSWERALLPATACQYAYMLYPVKNAEKFNKGEVKDFTQVGAKVVDERTFEVTLGVPCPYFLHLAAFKTLYPVRVDVIKKHGDRWSRPENMVSNGPFKLAEWEANQKIVMVPNEQYWDRPQVRLKKVVALPIEDTETAYKLFGQGQVDWLTSVPTPKIDEVKRLPTYYAMPYLGSYFYRINVTKPPFNDARVRRALVMGFDREIITRDILKGGQVPASWFCPAMLGYQPPKGLGYDREKARALLAEAGFPEGQGFPQVALLYNTNEAHKQVAENIVRQWKENLGITVALRNSEWKVYLSDVDQKNYEIARAGWIGDYVDPNTFLDMFVTDGGNNSTGWSNKEYDALIKQAASTQDMAARFKAFRRAEELLCQEEVPIIPVYIYVNQGLLAEKVAGWYENLLDFHPFHYMWIEPVK
ncbi:MAG: peptide ABC transporter substrate-binding protein [Planctomycetota bacterium]